MAESAPHVDIQPFTIPHWSQDTVKVFMDYIHYEDLSQFWEKLG